MKTPYQSKPLNIIHKQLKPENIKFSEAKIVVVQDQSKVARCPTQHAGNCTLEGALLEIIPEGWFNFSCNLSSSGSDDSWGILRFDFQQANGFVLWSSGAFWSPTIGNWAPWTFNSTYPTNLFDFIAYAQFFSHC